jgi:hypothetical protein
MGKALVLAGALLLLLGLLVMLGERFQIRFGQLPGDFTWRGKNTSVHFPLATCLLLSLLGSLAMWLLNRR